MVKEQKVIFGMRDVLALRATCKNCQGQISFNIPVDADANFVMVSACPHCRQTLEAAMRTACYRPFYA